MGVYTWIRESVRNAVLLGFNDAVEMIGPPSQQQDMNEQLTAVLKHQNPLALEQSQAPKGASSTAKLLATSSPAMAARPKRKRLGRSLGDIQEPGSTSPGAS